MDRAEHEDHRRLPRELRLAERLLEKCGFSDGCPGCIQQQSNAEGLRPHSDECHRRIYESMRSDNGELDRMIRVETRMGRAIPEAERIRRPKVDEADALNKPKCSEETQDASRGGIQWSSR